MSKVAVYALPDAVHNCDEDYLYFTMTSTLKKKEVMI